MKVEPTVDYGTLKDGELTQLGLDGAKAKFEYLFDRGRLNNSGLHARFGMSPEYVEIEDANNTGYRIVEFAQQAFGTGGEDFAVNTGMDGKLGTVAENECDSDEAVIQYGLDYVADGDEDNPKGWTGGAYVLARVKIEGTVYARKFAMACSGVQGSHDLAIARAGAQDAAAAWMERVEVRSAAGLSPITVKAAAGSN